MKTSEHGSASVKKRNSSHSSRTSEKKKLEALSLAKTYLLSLAVVLLLTEHFRVLSSPRIRRNGLTSSALSSQEPSRMNLTTLDLASVLSRERGTSRSTTTL